MEFPYHFFVISPCSFYWWRIIESLLIYLFLSPRAYRPVDVCPLNWSKEAEGDQLNVWVTLMKSKRGSFIINWPIIDGCEVGPVSGLFGIFPDKLFYVLWGGPITIYAPADGSAGKVVNRRKRRGWWVGAAAAALKKTSWIPSWFNWVAWLLFAFFLLG